ncbi:MAG: thioredoxin family protein [Bacteroidaceae bacterium]|nr:thioredoxin family protein [Bacteroidaceae bacterium]
MKRYITTILTLLLIGSCALAQWADPAKFTVSHKVVDDKEIVITFKGKIEQGWHVYSTDVGNAGPTAATFNIDKSKGLKPIGKLSAVGQPIRKFDPLFNAELSYFENSCTFVQRLAITEPEYSMEGYLEYGACNDRNCMPPTSVEVEFSGSIASTDNTASADNAEPETPSPLPLEEESNVSGDTATTLPLQEEVVEASDSALWASRVEEIKAMSEEAGDSPNLKSQTSNLKSLWWLFLMGFVGGLIAVLTPCVWPIIPMTVSFFLKRSENKKRGIKDALIYGVSIIVIYMALGAVATLLFGANAANALSTNAVVNIFFALLLIVFGLSFMGFFELQLPSSWSNKADRKAETTTGLISIFIMAFTLALVSFSCTGPIIGFMLVEVSTTNNLLGPLVCMFGFAVALALPFTLFAMFPTLLKKAPKSGSWMNTLKVVLGFVEIAFALKFVSVADMAYGWHLLSRDIFIGIWVVLAVLLGLYLLGVLRLPIDEGAKPKRNVFKTVLAVICFAFAAYMVPGVLGKPLKAISAFAPPMQTQHIRLFGEVVEAQFTNYEEGMTRAKAEDKPVLLDFTGYGCVNCREMEMNVWNDPDVAKRLREDFVLVSLFVDDKTPLPEHIKVDEYGHTTTLRTVGDKWSYLQRKRFGANVQPFYVLCSPDGEPLAPPYSYDTDVEKFLKFLDGVFK